MKRNIFRSLKISWNTISNKRDVCSTDIFIQKLNPMTGQMEWQHKEYDYDYHQEISNAGFGDMLHDTERNQKYYDAIKDTIKCMHKQGKAVHVLDIGTGTGILAMMAIKAGADTVTACEAFIPMANCAEKIFLANNCYDKVNLIKKRSTDIEIGKDMKQKANLLVTEILDTELIGEGAISIYNHAHDCLLTDDAVCIPSRANCYAQVVQMLRSQWNTLKVLANLDGDVLLRPPHSVVKCKGDAALHDVQLSQLHSDEFVIITKKPIQIFEFDFSRKEAREKLRSRNLIVTADNSGSANAVFFWWDIIMDDNSKNTLSCAPKWAHPDQNKESPLPWRDHWMQAIYYIPQSLHLRTNDKFILNSNHDEFSWWFDLTQCKKENLEYSVTRHTCSCNMHRIYSKSRIGQLNDSSRNKRYLRFFEQRQQKQYITKESNILLLGDGCVIGLACSLDSCIPKPLIWCCESNYHSQQFMQSLVTFNEYRSVKFIKDVQELTGDNLKCLTHIISEPYFINSILPWDNLMRLLQLLEELKPHISSATHIVPYAARIYAVPVEFRDLHKIRTPVKECEGFDIRMFDEMLEKSKSLIWSNVEAQPLWEYPCRALASPQCLLNITMNNFHVEEPYHNDIPIIQKGCCNGVCLWIDWLLDESGQNNSIISTGPTSPVIPGKYIQWDKFVRQGVHLFNESYLIDIDKSTFKYSIKFDLKNKNVRFKFLIQ